MAVKNFTFAGGAIVGRAARTLRRECEFRFLTGAEMAAMRFDPSPEQTRMVMRAICGMWDGSGRDPVPAHLIYPPTETRRQPRRRTNK